MPQPYHDQALDELDAFEEWLHLKPVCLHMVTTLVEAIPEPTPSFIDGS
jgi:hypothetical protein